jgi:LmbE family N-acetylglucosaminyl deacetylase
MAVLAHPDDESLGLGGTFAKYAAEGAETYLVTATRGQSGRFHGIPAGDGHPGKVKLAKIREAELRAAAQTLGVHGLALLDYMDGELDQVPPARVIAEIAAQLRRHRPQVVLTFPPDGIYGHPDHIAISQFTLAAIVSAANPANVAGADALERVPHAVSKCYYAVTSEASSRAYQAAFKKLISTVDGVERSLIPWPDWSITTVVDTRAHWSTVWRAVSCHDSQIAAYQALKNLAPDHHEALWGSQQFYRVFSTVNGGHKRESDLFEGLR